MIFKTTMAQKIISVALAAVLFVGGYSGTAYILNANQLQRNKVSTGPERLMEVLLLNETFQMSPFYIDPEVPLTGDLVLLAKRADEFYEETYFRYKVTMDLSGIIYNTAEAILDYMESASDSIPENKKSSFDKDFTELENRFNNILTDIEYLSVFYDKCLEVSRLKSTDPYIAESLEYTAAQLSNQLSLYVFHNIYATAATGRMILDNYPGADASIIRTALNALDIHTGDIYFVLASTLGTIDFLSDIHMAEQMFAYMYLAQEVQQGAQVSSNLSKLNENPDLTREEINNIIDIVSYISDENVESMQALEKSIDKWLSRNGSMYDPAEIVFISNAQAMSAGAPARYYETRGRILNSSIINRINERSRAVTQTITTAVHAVEIFTNGSAELFVLGADRLQYFFEDINTAVPGNESFYSAVCDISKWVSNQVDIAVRDSIEAAFDVFNINMDPTIISDIYSTVLKFAGTGALATAEAIATLTTRETSLTQKGAAVAKLALAYGKSYAKKNPKKPRSEIINNVAVIKNLVGAAAEMKGIMDRSAKYTVQKRKETLEEFSRLRPNAGKLFRRTGQNPGSSGGSDVYTPDPSGSSGQTGSLKMMINVLSAGANHAVGVRPDGTVIASGNNREGQLNVGSWTDIVEVSAGGDFTLGLKSNGTVVATGNNYDDQSNVGGWSDITAIAASNFVHSIGLRSNGTVVGTGDNWAGQLDLGGWSGITAIAAGWGHNVGLRGNGTVVAVGEDNYGQLDVGGWSDIIAIAAGDGHTVGLKSDGTVVAAGWNFIGQTNVGNWTDVVAIAAGATFTMGIRSDGTILAAGFMHSQLNSSGWTDIICISGGERFAVALKSDGTVLLCVNDMNISEVDVSGWVLKTS